MPRPAICLVTPGVARRENAESCLDLVRLAADASAAGVDLLQLREPHLSDADLFAILGRVLSAVDRARTAVLVNSRMDIAVAAGADGVHLRADAMHASRVRAVAPAGFRIGRSVHTVHEARGAVEDGGVDYLIFGTVFPTAGKPAGHPVAGLTALADVCAAVPVPVIAIGGITPERAAQVAAAGAAGVAAIGMFLEAARSEPGALPSAVRQIRRVFDT